MCSAADDPTMHDAPVCVCGSRLGPDHVHREHGTLGLSSPWAREGITREQRHAIEALIPAGLTVGVSVTPNKATWILWQAPEGTKVSPARRAQQLRISHSLPLYEALLWALTEHWRVAA